MSKVICDVCGTSYPDTVNQCPICGCARADVVDPAPQNVNEENAATGTYTYVKGGRFSKANVRKRNMERQLPQEDPQLEVEEEPENKGNSGNGLVVVAVALLLAIIGVIIYIFLRFFSPVAAPDSSATDTSTTNATTVATTATTELVVPCTELTLSNGVVEFDKVGAAELLDVTPIPADTTDTIAYVSENELVATVDAKGKVTAVGPGQTEIKITCGKAEIVCRVVCTMETEPTEETTQPTETQASGFELNRKDFTLFAVGSSWSLYNGNISQDEITWTTADEKIATVDKGVVTAVAPGDTVITAEYQGVKYKCDVRCRFTVEEEVQTQPTTGTESDNSTQDNVVTDGSVNTDSKVYTINKDDVTISVGESFTLTLTDENGEVIPVSWSFDSSVCTVSGNTVTGVAKAEISKVSTFYNGVAYECIIRVR